MQQLAQNHWCCFVDNDVIHISNGIFNDTIITVRDIPIMFNGISTCMILNCLPSIMASYLTNISKNINAGAMAMSDIMIKEGSVNEALLPRDLKLDNGLNFIPNVIIDTHFIKRGRFGRLAQAITLHPKHLGIGLGEDTALIINNNIATCRGSGMVIIIDGRMIHHTNAFAVKKNEPLYVTNLKVHLLVKGNSFSFNKRNLQKINNIL